MVIACWKKREKQHALAAIGFISCKDWRTQETR